MRCAASDALSARRRDELHGEAGKETGRVRFAASASRRHGRTGGGWWGLLVALAARAGATIKWPGLVGRAHPIAIACHAAIRSHDLGWVRPVLGLR